jgi:hypothetical protein
MRLLGVVLNASMQMGYATMHLNKKGEIND